MKHAWTLPLLILAVLAALGLTFACEKDADTTPAEPLALARRGGNGNGNGGGTTAPTTTSDSAYRDSLFAACGMAWDPSTTPTGLLTRTVQLANLRTSHVQRVSVGSDGTPYTYDVLVVEFDAAAIPGQTVTGYTLAAGPCASQCVNLQGQSYCLQGLPTATTRLYLPAPQKNIPPGAPCYGLVKIDTREGCIYASQPFQFTSSPLTY